MYPASTPDRYETSCSPPTWWLGSRYKTSFLRICFLRANPILEIELKPARHLPPAPVERVGGGTDPAESGVTGLYL